jgi:hypothetical protein
MKPKLLLRVHGTILAVLVGCEHKLGDANEFLSFDLVDDDNPDGFKVLIQ